MLGREIGDCHEEVATRLSELCRPPETGNRVSLGIRATSRRRAATVRRRRTAAMIGTAAQSGRRSPLLCSQPILYFFFVKRCRGRSSDPWARRMTVNFPCSVIKNVTFMQQVVRKCRSWAIFVSFSVSDVGSLAYGASRERELPGRKSDGGVQQPGGFSCQTSKFG